MCRPGEGQAPDAGGPRDSGDSGDSGVGDLFPWHIGVADAHCHPTDTMSSIARIPGMRARVLTVMATRSQDQDLVAAVAGKHGVRDRAGLGDAKEDDGPRKVVPAFGWHPWFSHQLYDDTDGSGAPGRSGRKAEHYGAVLTSAPDAEFIAGLPDPLPLSSFLAETRRRVVEAGTAMVGEIGLDKSFRLPWPERGGAEAPPRDEELTPGGREGRMLSPHRVDMGHQVRIFKAQLRLAGELGVAVSVHGVQAHGVLFDALASLWKGHEKEVVSRRKQKLVAAGAEDFSSSDEEEEEEEEEEEDDDDDDDGDDRVSKDRPRITGKRYKPKPFPPRVCLHSFSGSPQTVQQYLNPAIPARIYFSFSTTINLSTAGGESRFGDVVRACPDDRVLMESDLHCAGDDMDRALEDIARRICATKGWSLDEGVARMRQNYEEFVFG